MKCFPEELLDFTLEHILVKSSKDLRLDLNGINNFATMQRKNENRTKAWKFHVKSRLFEPFSVLSAHCTRQHFPPSANIHVGQQECRIVGEIKYQFSMIMIHKFWYIDSVSTLNAFPKEVDCLLP